MNKETKFKVGDKAHKTKGYKFPCTIVGVFETIAGEIRVIGEMDEYGLLHIFNENQLDHYENIDEKYIDYNGYRYYYKYGPAKHRESICLATKDPTKYCNGFYLYSTKDPGSGYAFVVTSHNNPNENPFQI